MSFRRNKGLYRALTIVTIVIAFAGVSYAQISVSILGATPSNTPLPDSASATAPSGAFKVTANPAVTSGSVSKVVFYRNDVPYKTVTSSPWEITEDQLGQDIYTYHARAYDSVTPIPAWAESGDFVMTVNTPHVFRMGDPIPLPSPLPSPAPTPYQTHGPDPFVDHTEDIREALAYLDSKGGGTLFFPCTPLYSSVQYVWNNRAIYNVSETIDIPSNVTLQGESSEWMGKCMIYWFDVGATYTQPGCNSWETSPNSLQNKSMFRLPGNTSHVRFRDLSIYSKVSGPDCYNRNDIDNIFAENTTGIEMDANVDLIFGCDIGSLEYCGGNISDVIFENVSIGDFTKGIKAVSLSNSPHEISDIKIRGYRAQNNYRQLFIDSPFAHDWDIQNLNISSMKTDQGGVEIINAGKPSEYTTDQGKIKFLELNCNGNGESAFCAEISKHGGLYFRQLHHEGVDNALIVKDLTTREPAETNPDPIVMESSMATGIFEDASMNLYLISNSVIAAPEINDQTSLDDGRLRFTGGGVDSTLIDCGDYHRDWTDTDTGSGFARNMLFSHSERVRGSFFAQPASGPAYMMPHRICPRGVSRLLDIYKAGGDFFDSGVLPNEDVISTDPDLYSNKLDYGTCGLGCNAANKLEFLLTQGGSVYVDGTFTLNRTVTVPRGAQIIGAPDAKLILAASEGTLFRIDLPTYLTDIYGASGIVIRNLTLTTAQTGKIGIHLRGDTSTTVIGVSRDIHFSGLTLEGFEKGIYASPYGSGTRQPMMDGITLKNMTFVNNGKAVDIFSSNTSNWNVMNLRMYANSDTAIGWNQDLGVHQGLQDVRCLGYTGEMDEGDAMADCIRLRMVSGFFLSGFKKTVRVTNGMVIGPSDYATEEEFQARQPSLVNFRNNDFSGSNVSIEGKSFITSMNNLYGTVSAASTVEANQSRLTRCEDSGNPTFGLVDYHRNLWVGPDTPTRIECGTRPVPWDDPVRWGGGSADIPLVGNFYDGNKEDLVIYRPATPSSEFRIRTRDTVSEERIIPWGTAGDTPLIGKFFAGGRSQVAAFGVLTGDWSIIDQNDCTDINDLGTCATYSGNLGGTGHAFVGNFLDETGDLDEIGVYNALSGTFYVLNPRTSAIITRATTSTRNQIQAGDFLGAGYDQIAQFDGGTWDILDASNGSTSNVTMALSSASGDLAVAGNYLSGACTQLGIWRPSAQKFYIEDPSFACGGRDDEMHWGSNNDIVNVYGTYTGDDDIPLTITDDGTIRRPASYRPSAGVFTESLAAGQWWIHDSF